MKAYTHEPFIKKNGMKIVTWNCQGAFRKKAELIARWQPDIALIQECECLEKLKFAPGMPQPTAQCWFGDNPSKGIGIFSFTHLSFEVDACYDPSIRHCVPLGVRGRCNLNLVAVWATVSVERKASYVGQALRALQAYRGFIGARETFLAGDFNSNKIWDRPPQGGHSKLVAGLAEMQIVSVYHAHFNEAQGAESQSTFYLQRNREKGYHLDYCFAPETWVPRLEVFSVGSFEDWIAWSDHSPLFAEFGG
jgi:exodeoxyribonuclease III